MKVKQKLLLAIGMNDQVCRDVRGANDNYVAVRDSAHLRKFAAVVNIGRSNDTHRVVNFQDAFRHDQQLFMTVPNSLNAFGFESLLKLGTHDGGFMHEKAASLDYLFPPSKYEITIAGNDFSGVFQSLFPQLSAMGYDISVYRDALKPISADSVNAMRAVGPKFFFAKERK